MEKSSLDGKFTKSSVQKLPKKRKFDPSVLEDSDRDVVDASKQKSNAPPGITNHFVPHTLSQYPPEPPTVLIPPHPPQSMAVDYSCMSQMPGRSLNNIVISYPQVEEKMPSYIKVEKKISLGYIKEEGKHGGYMKDTPMLVKREVYSDLVQNPNLHHQQNYLYSTISPSQNSHESNNQEVSLSWICLLMFIISYHRYR